MNCDELRSCAIQYDAIITYAMLSNDLMAAKVPEDADTAMMLKMVCHWSSGSDGKMSTLIVSRFHIDAAIWLDIATRRDAL